MSDIKMLPCQDCGVEFEFTGEEQEFYSSKGFSEPKRCKPCRDAKKQARRGGGGGGGYDRGPREMHDAVCAGCGCETQVPFRPDGRKPVYCQECFSSQRPY